MQKNFPLLLDRMPFLRVKSIQFILPKDIDEIVEYITELLRIAEPWLKVVFLSKKNFERLNWFEDTIHLEPKLQWRYCIRIPIIHEEKKENL